MVKLSCQVCGVEYLRRPSAAKNSKHCSRKCHNIIAGRIGGLAKKPGVNLGRKSPWLVERNLTNNPSKRGAEHPYWKDDDVGYIAIHNWAYRHVGLKEACEECGATEDLQMANKSQEYKREVDDWLTLCRKCHFAMDATFRRNGGVSRKRHRWSKTKPAD